MKHTQGEWEAGDTINGIIIFRKGLSSSIAHVTQGVDAEESLANAKLIATAPQLLEELMKLTKRLEDNWELITSGTQNGILTSLIEDGKKAIDNATK